MNLPEMQAIAAGPVILGVPACPTDSHLKHRWSGPREVSLPAFHLRILIHSSQPVRAKKTSVR